MDANRKPNVIPDEERYRHTFSEPGFFTYPGDTLTISVGHDGQHAFALHDRAGQPIAHGTLSHLNFHLVGAAGARGEAVPQPDQDAHPHPHLHPLTDTLVLGKYDARTTVAHDHPHTHSDGDGHSERHTHPHPHTGTELASVGAPGHTVDIHEHEH